MQTVAIGWIMATISSSDLMVALVQTATTLPAFILSILAGAIADNLSRRGVMLTGRVLIAAGSSILTLFVGGGLVDPWMILGASFVLGCGVALNEPAWQASVGDIVQKRDLPAAVTLVNVGYDTTRSVGPALGGIFIAAFGPLTTLALSTIGYLVPLIAVWRTKWTVRSSLLPREPIRTAIYDGARFTAISTEIKAAIARAMFLGLTGIATLALLPLIVRDQLGGDALTYGILMAGFGVGALIGGLGSSHLRHHLTQEWQIRLACIACGGCSLALALAPSTAVAAAALIVGGAGWVTAWSGLGISVQLASPRWIVGRTISIYYALTYGGIAAGSWFWGAVAEEFSLTWALGGSAGALALVAATGLFMPLIENQGIDADPLEAFEAPAVALDLKPRSGPIVVKIEYHIPNEKTEVFLTILHERRRAQSRIGARHWTIERDLQEPSQWTETFRTPTWTDYLRLNHRLTAADKELDDRLRNLHRGEQPPKTRLSIERPAGQPSKADHISPYVARV